MPRKAPARRNSTSRSSGHGKRGPLKLLGALAGILVFLATTGFIYLREPAAAHTLDSALGTSQKLIGTAVDRAEDLGAEATRPEAPGQYLVGRVERVIDGDTLLVRIADREERVRMLCVDAPESVHPDKTKNTTMGREALQFAKSRLEGRQVRLESEGEAESRDKQGRLLSYVLVDGENVNVELVAEGYSEYEDQWGKSRRYDHDFTRAQEAAQEGRRGIWKPGAR